MGDDDDCELKQPLELEKPKKIQKFCGKVVTDNMDKTIKVQLGCLSLMGVSTPVAMKRLCGRQRMISALWRVRPTGWSAVCCDIASLCCCYLTALS